VDVRRRKPVGLLHLVGLLADHDQEDDPEQDAGEDEHLAVGHPLVGPEGDDRHDEGERQAEERAVEDRPSAELQVVALEKEDDLEALAVNRGEAEKHEAPKDEAGRVPLSADSRIFFFWRLWMLIQPPTGGFATGTARFHRLGFVDGQVTTVMVLAMQGVDGLLAFFGAAHGDETEAAGAVGFTIHDQVGFSDGAVLSEKLVQVLFGGLEGKISYVQFHTIFVFLYLRLRPHADY
jgi:hypothetical protein